MSGDIVRLDVVPSREPSEPGPLTGMARRALVRALAALLVADCRATGATAAEVPTPGVARLPGTMLDLPAPRDGHASEVLGDGA